ncbi:NADAR family protein [Brevibacillus fluminis]|uniref:NADAR family protein n=1 Tax=Brevibacillus fluminis TaxID=511487 RepID=A0A3M8CZR4_9BACL|nr:NADAR family protein [Brevibacillus fluminis]RNB81128.1 NADAR family protein [Brevibacillus fluminis]
MKEKFTFFWKSHSPFSQWHKRSFNLNGMTFTCAEQAMMYGKAMLFGDHGIAQRILQTAEPREQKQLGRLVKNFDKAIWEQNCMQIVKEANRAKFTQHEDLLEALLKTAGTTIVEASPTDSIWGIGLAEDDPRASNRRQWKGTNWLGQVLTELREELMNLAE